MKYVPGWLLAVMLLAGGLLFTRCDCQGAGGKPCVIDADCPSNQYCRSGHCAPFGDGGGGDGGGQDGGGPDGDAGGWDGGSLPHCNQPADCQKGEVCFNGFCVVVTPDPTCTPGDADHCQNDTYCEPSLGGCVPWPAHPMPEATCEHIPPPGDFVPKEEWVWQNPTDAPEWDEVMMTPAVIDLTGKAGVADFVVPAVVFNSFRKDRGYSADGVLRAVQGDSGKPIWSVTDPANYTDPTAGIAAGDIDGDGLPEIVTGKNGGRDLICFKADGTLKWATNTGKIVVGWGGPAIANVDGEGLPEIVMGANVLDADGNLLWHKDGSSGDNYITHASAPFSVPVDVNNDGKMEIVTGDVLYDYQGNEIWNTGFGDGFVAVADFNGDGRPEIVVVAQGTVRLQSSTNGAILWLVTASDLNKLPECQPNCGLLGPPTIADFDGDGKPEIGVAGANVYIVLDTWGQVKWHIPSRDASSNITGSAVFDFEGDHLAEVVYADEISLKVLRGTDGQVLYEQPHSSLTACEYPVIADVDGDHKAEIVIAENDLMADAPQKFKGIRVYGDSKDNWVATRRIWNQHAYHVTNVEENGAIPNPALQNWKVDWLNNFRQNVQGSGLFDAPDLTARGLGFHASHCQTDGVLLGAEISNRGKQGVGPGVPVSFYLGDPRNGGTLLGVVRTTQPLAPGVSEIVTFLWQNPPLNQVVDIYVIADDNGGGAVPNGEHSECREDNNVGFILGVVCKPET